MTPVRERRRSAGHAHRVGRGAIGLLLALGFGVGIQWAAAGPLGLLRGAMVLGSCLAALGGVIAVRGARQRRHRRRSWDAFEREFWEYVRLETNRKRHR
jgi:hypothetical protein